jgi:hypothetical protein
MGRKNTSNPHDADPDVFHKETNMSVQKARVMAVNGMPDDNGFHTVRIEVYGDDAPYTAPVITPMYGCVWVPEAGTDVAVIFSEADKPWVIGSWYAVDRVDENDIDIPDYEPGDIRIGNRSGSHVTVKKNGSIQVRTAEQQIVNIDHQSGTAYMGSDYTLPGDDLYYKLPFDTRDQNDDPEALFDATEKSYTVRDAGIHRIETTAEVASAGQNNSYQISVFKNDTEFKRRSRQSSVNEPLSLSVDTQRYFEEGDEIDIRMKQNSGSDKIVASERVTTEFSIARKGI